MSTLAELNVTPMLDLAFVLLIIFMITAPLLASRVDLIIPTTRAKRDAVAAERTVIVEMNNEGVLEIEGDVMTEQDLKQRLETSILAAAEGQDEARAFRNGPMCEDPEESRKSELTKKNTNRLTYRNSQRTKTKNQLEMEVDKDLSNLI